MKPALTRPITYLITDGAADPENFQTKKIVAEIRNAADDGVSLVQIREKNLPAKLLFELAKAAVDVLRGTGTLLFLNDRADIALAAGADGVQLTESSLPVNVVRETVGAELIIGVSTHDQAGVLAAKVGGADFATYSPVFASPGKGRPKGLRDLELVCRLAAGFPVVALGGIDETNVADALAAGAAGAAGIRCFVDPRSRQRIINRISGLQPVE